MRWTWFIERDGECWQETFATTDQAIAAMAERQGMPAEDIPARMAQIGMFLASVRVTVTPLMVLRPAGVAMPDSSALIDAAFKHSDLYEGREIPANETRAAINNAFFAGATFATRGVGGTDGR